jgi:hypothetical protein
METLFKYTDPAGFQTAQVPGAVSRLGGGGEDGNHWFKVNIKAHSAVWKNWCPENSGPFLIWGKNADANVGRMFGSMSVSDTRRYWQTMSIERW